MEESRLMPYADQGGDGLGSRYNVSAAEKWGGLWLLEFHMRMQKRFRYKEIVRNRQLEEQKLRETAWCDLFHARILPRVCQLRERCGFDCDACRGLSSLRPS
ncbi:MAG: hypothetical protein JRE23_06285 [Deltaproteobacteria bacterium]|nr:hypothetical protein [Deltaproteobacteria bacterium]